MVPMEMQSLATSPHHPFVLSSSSDGTVAMHSGVRALRRRRVKGHFSQKVYSLDFERETGKWRMKDNWQVEVSLTPSPPSMVSMDSQHPSYVNSIVALWTLFLLDHRNRRNRQENLP